MIYFDHYDMDSHPAVLAGQKNPTKDRDGLLSDFSCLAIHAADGGVFA